MFLSRLKWFFSDEFSRRSTRGEEDFVHDLEAVKEEERMKHLEGEEKKMAEMRDK